MSLIPIEFNSVWIDIFILLKFDISSVNSFTYPKADDPRNCSIFKSFY